jgi:hypothetical protein
MGASSSGYRLAPVDPRRAGDRLRPGYCDEAASKAGDILALVAWGMHREIREVFDLVRAKLEGMAEEGDEDANT